MSKIKSLYNLSIIKTLRFNFHYFSFRDAIKLPVLVTKKVHLRNLKGEVKINGRVRFGMIRLGFDTLGIIDYPRERAVWEVFGKVIFEGSASLGAAVKISVLETGIFRMGDHFTVTGLSRFIVADTIEIGKECLISWDVQIMDTDFHDITDKYGNIMNPTSPIKIGDHVWIGCKTLVLKGTEIPSNVIIGADSLVSSHLTESNAIYGGKPLKPLKREIEWIE